MGCTLGIHLVPASGVVEIDDPLLQVQQRTEGGVEEIAATTGGVEDLCRGQAVLERLEASAGTDFIAGTGQGVRLLLGDLPLAAQGIHDHGLDDKLDVGGAGVVGAELGALGGVEGALEQGAENGWLDVAPVFLCCLFEVVEGVQAKLHGVDRFEQVAVEMGHLVGSEEAAAGHLAEQVLRGLVEQHGIVKVLADDLGEKAVGQQAGVLGVEAEHDLVQVAGELFRSRRCAAPCPALWSRRDLRSP